MRCYAGDRVFLQGSPGFARARAAARRAAEEARWLRRLEREIGGGAGRGRVAGALGKLGQKLALRLALAVWPETHHAMPGAAEIRRILLVRTNERVGNQLLTTPLLRALREGLPHAELHLLASARHAGVVAGTGVHRLIRFEKREAWRRPWRLLALLGELRRARYQVVIEAGHYSGSSLTSSLLARIAGGDRAALVGHARGTSERFLSHPVRHEAANENEVRAKLELLRPLGLLPRGLELETELGHDESRRAALLAEASVALPYAVLNPGARLADRRWPPESHAAVARALAGRGLSVLVVWGPGERDIASRVAELGAAHLAPPTDLDDLAALFRGARLCVSNNSGPMHLAVAVRAPTVGLFLAGESGRWGHELPWFEAASPADELDHAPVLRACYALLARETPGAHGR